MIVQVTRANGFPIRVRDNSRFIGLYMQELDRLREKYAGLKGKALENRLERRMRKFELRIRKEFQMSTELDISDDAAVQEFIENYGPFTLGRKSETDPTIAAIIGFQSA